MNVATDGVASLGLPRLFAQSGGGFDLGEFLLPGAIALGLGIILRFTYRRLNRSIQRTPQSARDNYASMAAESHARRDVEHVLLELDEVARQIHGRIDTKFAKLESIIRDADERIDRLSRLVSSADGKPSVDVTLDQEVTTDPPETAAGSEPNSNSVIYSLADGGMPAVQIAEQVGRTTGEIELIIALRKTKLATRKTSELGGTPRPAPTA